MLTIERFGLKTVIEAVWWQDNFNSNPATRLPFAL